jgi:hypothetical protein
MFCICFNKPKKKSKKTWKDYGETAISKAICTPKKKIKKEIVLMTYAPAIYIF